MKVELVSYTPNPVESCGRAAGICYDKEQKEDYGSFIKRIISYGHMDVIEHANFTFRVEGISRACSHQLVRHRHSSFSQRSQRYVSEKESSFILPSLEYVSPEKREEASSVMREYIKRSYEVYASLIKLGVKKEGEVNCLFQRTGPQMAGAQALIIPAMLLHLLLLLRRLMG